MSFKDKLLQDRYECFNKDKPADITVEQWEAARHHASLSATKLPKEVEQSAFYFYYIGDSFEDIAAKLSLPMETLIYTALYFNWHERKNLSTSVRAGAKVKKADAAAIDLITDSIVATAAIYKSKLADAIKNPQGAENCPLIPKNFKELQTLLMMLQSLQSDKVDEPRSIGPAINVNIANLGAAHTQPRIGVSDSTQDIEALPPAETLELDKEGLSSNEKIEIMKLLEKVKRT